MVQKSNMGGRTIMENSIYKDIAERTKGDIYIGVVGPVRTGKSTFIKRFMESVVLPNMVNEYDRERARDELPQSAGGKTVMTTEPKFIPDDAVKIMVGDNVELKVKMIDCVGYLVPEAIGGEENGEVRMVHTPWSDAPVPFDTAAETGTKRVISEHSTIGMLVTTDGTIGDFSRDNYVGVEERVARELSELGKPFAVILNSARPDSPEAVELAVSLEEKYGAPVALVNCMELNGEDISHILEMVLMEFPVREITVKLPVWTAVLDEEHRLIKGIYETVGKAAETVRKLSTVTGGFLGTMNEGLSRLLSAYGETKADSYAFLEKIEPGTGSGTVEIRLPEELYYTVISEISGIPMQNESDLLETLRTLSEIKREYDKYSEAIRSVDQSGYGIVMPDVEDLHLEEPEIVRQSGGYGVRIRAKAPSVHLIKADIETEINPIVGTEQQSEEFIRFLTKEFAEKPEAVWQSNLFGRSLHELVSDGIHTKLHHLPDDARMKFGETLSKIINEGSQGLICIIL